MVSFINQLGLSFEFRFAFFQCDCLGISAFVLLGDDAMGVEIICLVRRFRLNTVFKKGRQIYGMNFLAFLGKFFLY